MILNNLVFSGGSIRAIGYIGCLKALEEYDSTEIGTINIVVGKQ